MSKKNTEIWAAVDTTDPQYVKKVNRRGGFHTVCAQYQVLKATELWGPYGVAWGLKSLSWGEVRDQESRLLEVTLDATFFFPGGEFPISSDLAYEPGNETRKKLRTDCQSKALSLLGFSADIFMGAFDGNRYLSPGTEPQPKQQKQQDVPPPDAYDKRDDTPFSPEEDFSMPGDEDPAPKPKAKPSACISDKQRKLLFAMLFKGVDRADKGGQKVLADMLKAWLFERGIDETNQIPKDDFNDVLKQLPEFNPKCADRIAELLESKR